MRFEVAHAALAGIQSTLGDARGAVAAAAGSAPASIEGFCGAVSLVGEHMDDVRDTAPVSPAASPHRTPLRC